MKQLSLILTLLCALGSQTFAADPPTRKTIVSIVGEDFTINGRPTYAGRSWNGHRVEGLLLNSRMVQATYDDHDILKPARVHELINRVRKSERNGHRLLVGTSYGGGSIPKENVVRASDFLLLHGNGVKDPKRITEMVKLTRSVPGYRSMPIVFNEDDHENFDQPTNNFAAALAEHVSWGWFDYRRKGEGMHEGYQSPPVNWGLSSERKRAFFTFCAEITGAVKPTKSLR